MQLRDVLSGMERRLRSRCSPSVELQRWLQLTYEIETRYFERKRLAADSQLKAAKDMVGPLSTSCNEFVILAVLFDSSLTLSAFLFCTLLFSFS